MNFYSPVSNTKCHSIGHKMRIARIKIRVDSQGSTCISKFLESKRKIIPCFRSGIREASLAELELQYWKFISESVRRSESSSAGQISCRCYNVRQVGRSTANMHQMHKYAQFKRYAKLNWEPVQTPKRWSDMLSCSSASDESGGCILDPLQWID